MIDLTPLEVRQKKGDFRSSFRGYDPELVNDFLDLVADRMEELVKKNMELRDSAESMEEELEAYRTKESALSDALMSAQKLREDARSHADKEGELLIREARLAAEAARQEASRALAREEQALLQVRARRAQLVDSFRRLLERELGELTVIEETLELEGSAESPPAGPARKPAGPSRPMESAGPAQAGDTALEPGSSEPAGAAPLGGAAGEGAEGGGEGADEAAVDPWSAPDAPAGDGTPEGPSERPDSAERAEPAEQAESAERAESSEGAGDIELQEDWLKSLVEE